MASTKEADTKWFIMRNVMVHFGVPKVLIPDNGIQFDGKIFRKFCVDLRIEYWNFSLGYP